MRVHTNYDQLQLWRDPVQTATYARVENLVSVRIEPVLRQVLPHSSADLVFRAQEGYFTIACALLDSPQIVLRETDVIVWPAQHAAHLSDEHAFAIESFLMPWIRSITMGRALNKEVIRHFGAPADRAAFEDARSRNCAGAAPLASVAGALAPYVYAARYADGNPVIIRGAADAVQGAAFLARDALVELDASDSDLEFAAKWFGLRSLPAGAHAGMIIAGGDEAQNVEHVPVQIRIDAQAQAGEEQCVCAQAYPLDMLFSFEDFHGPPARTFAVRAQAAAISSRPAAFRTHRTVGGSGGRILFGLRRNFERIPDSDTESALALAGLLRAEGFIVDVCGEPALPDYPSYDVVHCFNAIEAATAADFLARAKQCGIRTILTTQLLDVSSERTWGAQTAPTCIKQELDEATIGKYLSFMARRALLSPGWDDRFGRGPYDDYEEVLDQAAGFADCLIAESQSEAAFLRGRFAQAREIRTVAPFLRAPEAERGVPPVAWERFVLLHAPIEPRCNQLFAVRAAREASRKLVLAGPVADIEYAARVREASGHRVVIVDPRGPEQIDWLYAQAETILDASWYAYGTARLWKAVLSGAAVCASELGWGPSEWPGAVVAVDPASPEKMAHCLKIASAPSAAERQDLAQRLDQGALLRNVLGAYLALEPAAPQA